MGEYFGKKWVRDKNLMDTLEDHWSWRKVRAFNHCWIYLQVLHLSDITTGDGMKILPEAFQGTTHLPSQLQWLNQGKPSPGDWIIWQKMITREFLSC